MIEIIKNLEETGFHKAADITLNYSLQKFAQTPSTLSTGEFLSSAGLGDIMAGLGRGLQPMLGRTGANDLIKMVFNAPVEELYDRMKNIQYTNINEQQQDIFNPSDITKDPSFASVGLGGEGNTSEVFHKTSPQRDLRNFLPVLTSPMLILTALRGMINGYIQMTRLNPDPSKNPSPFPSTYPQNRTMGQQFGIPEKT